MAHKVDSGLAGRINRYVNYRRTVQKSKGSFAEALSDKSVEDGSSGRSVRRPVRRSRQTGRRSTRVAAHGGARGRLKHITGLQAKRLAGHASTIMRASQKYNVPVELICAVILQESGGRNSAVSHCGARGLMQLMPATARRLGVSNSFDSAQNIMGGTKYLRMLMDRFDGNIPLALAGYNAGEGNVEKYGRRIPPFRETRAYVPNVLKYADTLWTILRRPVTRVAVRPTVNHQSAAPAIRHRTIYRVPRA